MDQCREQIMQAPLAMGEEKMDLIRRKIRNQGIHTAGIRFNKLDLHCG